MLRVLLLKFTPIFSDIGIEGHQVSDEAFFLFPIWEAQAIIAETGVVALYRQISALVDYRDGIVGGRVHAVQRFGISLFVRHALQVVLVTLQ